MSENKLRHTLRRLRNNDPTLTTLDFRDAMGKRSFLCESGSGLFHEIIKSLTANTTVRTVRIVLQFLCGLTLDEKLAICRAIGLLPNLKEFRVTSMGFDSSALKLVNEVLRFASKANRLEVLTLYNTPTKYSFSQNNYNPSSRVGTYTKRIQDFLQSLKQLTKLRHFEVKDAQMIFDLNVLVLKGLASMPSLVEIEIKSHVYPNRPRLSAASLSALAALPNLKFLALRRLHLGRLLPRFLVQLTRHSCLETLNLGQNMMRADGAVALITLLRRNATLKKVSISNNLIPDELGAAIANVLSENGNIVEFAIGGNYLGRASCRAFARTLEAPNSKLEYLNLSLHTFPGAGIQQIAEALRINTKLKSLSICGAQMPEAGGRALAYALRHNSTLERLDLAETGLVDSVCSEFAQVMETNRTLKSLNLSSNRISNTGAIPLAEALLVNSTLQQLNLQDNHGMKHKSYEAFEEMIQQNWTLQHLWLPADRPGSMIPSFLWLNKLGRKDLLQEMDNARKWLRAVYKCRDDLVPLHYLIHMNPNVVSWMVADA